MSKRKIGSIKGMPVVEGYPNEVTKHEYHYKEDDDGNITLSKRDSKGNLESGGGGNSSSGNSDLEILYYKNGLYNPDPNSISKDELAAIETFFYYCSAILSINDLIAPGIGKIYSEVVVGDSEYEIFNANEYFKLDVIAKIEAFSEYKIAKEVKIHYNSDLYNFELPAQSFIENYKYYNIKMWEVTVGTPMPEDMLENINSDVAVLYKYFTPITKEEYDNLAKQN